MPELLSRFAAWSRLAGVGVAPGPGHRVFPDRDRRAVLDFFFPARAKFAQASPFDVRVNTEFHRPFRSVGVDFDGFDLARFDAVRRRRVVAGEDRPRARVLFRGPRRRRVFRVVFLAATEELEARRQVVADAQVVGLFEVVVAEVKGVDDLVFVDTAEDLALRARLRLFDFDRRQRRFGFRFGGAFERFFAGDGFAVGVELRFEARFLADVRGGVVFVEVVDGEGGGFRFDFEGQSVFGGSAEVGDVFDQQRRFFDGRSVRENADFERFAVRPLGRPLHVFHAFRQDVTKAEVVAAFLTNWVLRHQRNRLLGPEQRRFGRLHFQADVRFTGRGSDPRCDQRDRHGQAGQRQGDHL